MPVAPPIIKLEIHPQRHHLYVISKKVWSLVSEIFLKLNVIRLNVPAIYISPYKLNPFGAIGDYSRPLVDRYCRL